MRAAAGRRRSAARPSRARPVHDAHAPRGDGRVVGRRPLRVDFPRASRERAAYTELGARRPAAAAAERDARTTRARGSSRRGCTWSDAHVEHAVGQLGRARAGSKVEHSGHSAFSRTTTTWIGGGDARRHVALLTPGPRPRRRAGAAAGRRSPARAPRPRAPPSPARPPRPSRRRARAACARGARPRGGADGPSPATGQHTDSNLRVQAKIGSCVEKWTTCPTMLV